MRTKTLVVDDNRLMREFMAKLLKKQGQQVFLAKNGFEALNILSGIQPDIIFIDLVMPKIDGSKLCRIIRNLPPHEECFLVVISAAAAEIGEDFKVYGADACIAKGSFDQMAKHILAMVDLASERGRDRSLPILGTDNIQPRQMTRELLRRNRHLESIIDSISDGIIETYVDRIIQANPAALFLFNQSPETLIGTSFPNLFDKALQPQIRSLMTEENLPPPGTVDTVIPSDHGRRHVVVKRLSAIPTGDTRLFLLTDVTELKKTDEKVRQTRQKLEAKVARRTADLTRTNRRLNREIGERKKTDEALQQSRKRFEQFMQHMPSIAFIKDLQGRYTYANQAYQTLFGLPPEERIGKTDFDLWPPEIAGKLRENDNLILDGKKAVVKVEVLQIDNETHHQLVSKFPIFKDGIPHAVGGIAVDITRRVQAEEERSRLAEKLQGARKMEAIGNLAGGVAHELNNILSGIVSFPELILLDLEDDSPLHEPLLTIKQAGERAAAIVQDLLVLARQGIAVTEVAGLNDIVKKYLRSRDHARLVSKYPGVKFSGRLASSHLNLVCSAAHLEKTIAHLMTHAAGSVKDEGTIHLTTETLYLDKPLSNYNDVTPGNYVALTVADTGTQLSAEQMERIYEPFFTNKILGRNDTGLGMAVVWGTVKEHRGYIESQSSPQGNAFTLYFPATGKHAAEYDNGTALEAIMGTGESILVVDDVEEQRNITRCMLEKLAYQVTTVTSGEEAIAHIKGHRVDLVILDMIMDPGIDGLDTYRRILAISPNQKAIIASGYSESDRVREALRLGAGAYIKKPYLIEKIGSAIHRELARPAPTPDPGA